MMKAKVDENTCVGCGLCVDACPEVFEVEGGLARTTVNPIPPEAEEKCRNAAKDCPVEAIEVQDD